MRFFENSSTFSVSGFSFCSYKSTNDGDTHDNIDVGIFEKIKECHIENDDNKLYSEDDKQEEGKENDIFTINMKNTEEPEEERLKGIYIDMTSVYP
jgi:hypothetical protein